MIPAAGRVPVPPRLANCAPLRPPRLELAPSSDGSLCAPAVRATQTVLPGNRPRPPAILRRAPPPPPWPTIESLASLAFRDYFAKPAKLRTRQFRASSRQSALGRLSTHGPP